MATIATLDTVLRARTQKFDQSMKKSNGLVRAFTKSVKLMAVAGAAAGAATVTAVSSFTRTGDEIDKMSKRTGVATDEIQSLTFAIEQNGGTAEGLEKSIRRMNQSIGDLASGTGETLEHFKAMGVSFEDIENLGVADRFRLIAKSLNAIEDDSLRADAALALFGRQGDTVRILTKDMDKLEESFRDMGLTVSGEQIAAAAELTDQWNILNRELRLVGANLMEVFGPTVLEAVRLLGKGVGAVVDSIKELERFVNGPLAPAERVKARRVSREEFIRQVGGQAAFDKLTGNVSTQTKIQRDIKRQIEQSVPALEKGSFETIRFLRRQNDDRKQSNEKQVGLLEKINENLVSIEGAIAGNQAGFGQVGFQIDPLGALR